ncbi:amino acid ABC transporter substrate-binding protein [Clostridium tarantellae]|uniref:Transporter substrate-binding domain-containing protein n=1 Tax=Clostridium tarantellae TaxID=39493 RepID=A0A6I1MI19_9CLOT|nr:amino acid ABC transporter substrate-binding protein [Clostridium tarantellae]MPQ43196.1 transporter substrate-binding domain-containing protein [Clostridium tarantellae]
MKKSYFKFLYLLICIFILSFSFISCSSNKENNTFIIGLDDTFVPMGFRDEKNNIVGFDVDLAKEALYRLGFKVEFQPIDWSMKETELSNYNIDAIWNGYTLTKEREKKISFTKPYLKNKQVIITLKSSSIKNKEDLKGKKVSTQNGSSSLDALEKHRNLLNNFYSGNPILFDTFNEAFMDLESGRTDALVVDEVLARYYIQKRGFEKFKVLNDNFGNEEYSVGLRKEDSNLLKKLNNTLEEMKKDGTISKISTKWFGKDITK